MTKVEAMSSGANLGIRVSVVIVSWNARSHLKNCLESVRQHADTLRLQVIVVDNASADGSADMVEEKFPEALLIRAGENLGFARANNLGFAYAKGDFVALVNSDVIVHPGCLETLAAFLSEHAEVGMVGPRVLGADGKLQRTCRRLPRAWNTLCRALALDRALPKYPLFSGYEMRHFNHDELAHAEVLSGCFCVVRRDALSAIGGLDERFFFYMEDVDWCKRFSEGGWRTMFVPEASATHFGGGSTASAPLFYSIEIHRANLQYWRKHHGIVGQGTYYALATLHHGVRLVARFSGGSSGLIPPFPAGRRLRRTGFVYGGS